MAWARMDDGLDEHPKVEKGLDSVSGAGFKATSELVGLAALGLWALSLANSSRRLTDGEVTPRTLRKLAPEHGERLAAILAEDFGMYDVEDGGFRIHDYLDYNPARADVLERRERDSERKARGRASGVRKDSARNPDGHTADGQAESARPGPVPSPEPHNVVPHPSSEARGAA